MFGGGLLPAEYLVIAARPSCGKSALAVQIMAEIGVRGVKSSFFSLEMTEKQIFARLLAYFTHVDTRMVMRDPRSLSSEQRETIAQFHPQILTVADNVITHAQASQTLESVRAQAREDVAEGAEVIVIDYLQRFAVKEENRNVGVGKISNGVQDMAKELGVPVILLSQLSRSVETQGRLPMLSDLRDSGSIEQDANTVIFIHKDKNSVRDDFFSGMLLQAKGRDMGTTSRKITFKALHQTFYQGD
jgi:replicative DNA helicase